MKTNNETYSTETERSRQTTSLQLGTLNEMFKGCGPFVEIINSFLKDVYIERDEAIEAKNKALLELESTQRERDEYKNKFITLKDAYADQGIQLQKCKNMLTDLQEHFQAEKEAENNGIIYPPCEFIPDICEYKTGTDSETAIRFWNIIWELKDIKKTNGSYLIKGLVDIVPVFLVVSKSKDYENPNWFFCGTQDSFCKNWNCFVANRETDPQRRDKLTCKPASFNSALSDITYGRDPSQWKKMFREGKGPVKELKRVINIQEQITKRWYY